MNRRIKKAIWIASIGIIVTAVAIWPSALAFVVEKQLRALRTHGTQLTWTGLHTRWNSISLETLSTSLPGPTVRTGNNNLPNMTIPLPLDMESPKVTLIPSSLLTLSPKLTFATTLYGGTLSGEVSKLRTTPFIKASLESLLLDHHPLVGGTGIRGGILHLKTESLSLPPAPLLPQGTIDFQLSALHPPQVPELKSFLGIESLGPVDLKGSAMLSGDDIVADKITITSPLTTAIGTLAIHRASSENPDLDGTFRIHLTSEGTRTFGPWLSLATSGQVENGSESFRVTVSTQPCAVVKPGQPRIPIGRKCLEYAVTPN
jgi:hypothetical protein